MFTQTSPVLDIAPFTKIEGDSITWRREASLPGTAWRPVGGTYTSSEGRIDAFTERLMILGGEVTMDNFVVATQGKGDNAIDIKASHYSLKAQAIANAFDQAFFEGDDLVDPNTMVGLRRRLSGNQVLNFGATAGTTLTLAMLDQLRDTVPFANACYFMNRTLRRKVSALIQAQTGSGRIDYTQDSFGRQIVMYADTPIYIVERTGRRHLGHRQHLLRQLRGGRRPLHLQQHDGRQAGRGHRLRRDPGRAPPPGPGRVLPGHGDQAPAGGCAATRY